MSAKVNLWFHSESELARCYAKVPLAKATESSDFVWVPKSIIEHTSQNVGGHHVVTLPEWFVLKEGL